MEVYTFLCVLSMVVAIAEGTGTGLYMHSEVIFPEIIFVIKCICTVTLSADALPAPGGYVAPERGNVTFTCNHICQIVVVEYFGK